MFESEWFRAAWVAVVLVSVPAFLMWVRSQAWPAEAPRWLTPRRAMTLIALAILATWVVLMLSDTMEPK